MYFNLSINSNICTYIQIIIKDGTHSQLYEFEKNKYVIGIIAMTIVQ